MISVKHPNETRALAKEQDEYNTLSIADFSMPHGNEMHSLWRPSMEEIAAINRSYAIRLSVLGMMHPPVMLDIVDWKYRNG